ncbi:MAG: EamA family transporter [Rhodospirillaceae bacterium]|nr:EamA family transporter [Rhodospirillaceae bacterium]|tara:strand:+ start:36315 stop:37205 length:891 start_codon:yes stop_codon:yes gene_type:complete
MKDGISVLLLVVVVISWGLSWYPMGLQLGEVPPLVSVVYRFLLSAGLVVGYLAVTRRLQSIPLKQHGKLFALGFCIFSMNYYCFYVSAEFIATGVLSVVFATAAIMAAFNQRLFFGEALGGRVVLGAIFGVAGLLSLFWGSISATEFSTVGALIFLPFLGTYLFSLGNIFSVRLSQKHDLPSVIAYGMIYGTIISLVICLALGLPFTVPNDPVYLWSLAYLSVIATVLGFVTYLSLVNRVGPARAAYSTVLFPIVAMLVSTWFEGFQWTGLAVLGLALTLCGTFLVYSRPQTNSKT